MNLRTAHLATWVIAAVAIGTGNADERAPEFETTIRPLLNEYCLKCHSTEKQKGDLDLERFTSFEEVKRHPKIWQSVEEQLGLGEMPPKKKPQPSAPDKARLSKWVHGVLNELALEHAGDPGPVVLRRLSNAEYTWTVRDLTGIASLDPAREFPVDGAAGEGFSNVGAALVMSPATLTKYLDAAKDIAAHAVLLSDGIRFSEKTTRRDWTDEMLARIREFYARYSEAGGAQKVDLQGVIFDTNGGGRLPVEEYFAAILIERDALASGAKTIETVAREHRLNSKYLGLLWTMLQGDESSFLLDELRTAWRAAGPNDAAKLAAHVAVRQKALWKFSSVGQIGKTGGPKAWMEPLDPVIDRQEIRLKMPAAAEGNEVVISLQAGPAGDGNDHDAVVWEQPRLVAPGRPDLLLRDVRRTAHDQSSPWGLAEDRFGKMPDGAAIDPASLGAQAPDVIEIRLPADLVEGCEFVSTGVLHDRAGAEGSVQLRAVLGQAEPLTSIATDVPIITRNESAARARVENAFTAFRDLFPSALCYTKIVPVDEVITLVLFHREDDALCRLMLGEEQKAQLDRMWDDLRFISQDALKQVDVFDQLWQYATQDADPKVFEPLRQPIRDGAAAFRERLAAAQPRQLESVLEFAELAWRRPLTEEDRRELRELYTRLRTEELPHETALRLTLARVLVAPDFLYKMEEPAAGATQAPVNDWELATRLSYFLWSSTPDAELRELAASNHLHESDTLLAQIHRLLADDRVKRLVSEFAGHWLHTYGFDRFDEKSEQIFPTFAQVRAAMDEEPVHFFTDFFQRNGSVLDLLEADYTFVNETLAKHYGLEGVTGGEWRRVDGMRSHGRGGILGFGAVLAKQSGASRTSPILRGNWLSETLLGERLPRPPKGVPVLPDDATATAELTERQLTERHVNDPSCARCHVRIDPFGFALEHFDAIGRFRETDAAGRVIDTRVKLADGTQFDGLDGLRDYLLHQRRDAFVRQFCRKLLGYALGRGVILSDQPLLEKIEERLAANEWRVGIAIEEIVNSRQFREIRGRSAPPEDVAQN